MGFPLARVEGFVNGRNDLVFVDIVDAFGFSEQLLAESRMGNVDKGQRSFADGLAMQIGDSKFRNDITHGTARSDSTRLRLSDGLQCVTYAHRDSWMAVR